MVASNTKTLQRSRYRRQRDSQSGNVSRRRRAQAALARCATLATKVFHVPRAPSLLRRRSGQQSPKRKKARLEGAEIQVCLYCQETGRVCALCGQAEECCECSETCGIECPMCRAPLRKLQMAGFCIGFAVILGFGVYLIPY